MLTRRGLFAASGALFCALTGCTLNKFNLNLLGTVTQRGTVLDGSLEVTAQATQQALRDMGLFVESSHGTDKVILTSTTKSGHRFTLNLCQHTVPNSDRVQTRIDIQWDKEPDEQFWMDLLGATARIQFSRSGAH